MGYHNARKVFENWTHLNHREVRALTFMALATIDQDEPPRYWDGWQNIARALGANMQEPDSARQTAMRALGALAKAGAIVSSGQARAGVRAEYALALDTHQTFTPRGKGRTVSWAAVPRQQPIERPAYMDTSAGTFTGSGLPVIHVEPVTATGTQPVTDRGTLANEPVTATDTQGVTDRGTQPVTVSDTQPVTATGTPNRTSIKSELRAAINTLTQHPAEHADTNTHDEADAYASEIIDDDPFTEFWAHYPRKVGKRKAETKFKTALKRASAETIIAAAQKLANDPNLPELRYVKHPATWLEGDCWTDPPYERALTTSERRMKAGYEVMQRMATREPAPDPFMTQHTANRSLTGKSDFQKAIETDNQPAPSPWDKNQHSTSEYEQARDKLMYLPDAGQALIEQVTQEHPEVTSIQEKVILAAKAHARTQFEQRAKAQQTTNHTRGESWT